ncbi:DUF1697 domain-containing protein [uncultured Microbacterium sp.]|uniref:DUF1697 domain-containing protein n=1 Tax=uncultured Microbacterium sp. TaxID=191216 RepID=UPI0025E7A117|nr:DUF1697 domain-containing protein [uncultured Microbacterium sp.]
MTTPRCAMLLRAVNVGGAGRVPMAELRSLLAEQLGLRNVSTYIASGNILCEAPEDPDSTRAAVRALIRDAFAVDTPVILRTHDRLARILAENPFPDAEDKLLHAMFLEGEPERGAVDALTERLRPGERIALRGEDLWVDYAAGGVHATALTRPVLDKALGVAGTARNLRTVRKLVELTAS